MESGTGHQISSHHDSQIHGLFCFFFLLITCHVSLSHRLASHKYQHHPSNSPHHHRRPSQNLVSFLLHSHQLTELLEGKTTGRESKGSFHSRTLEDRPQKCHSEPAWSRSWGSARASGGGRWTGRARGSQRTSRGATSQSMSAWTGAGT